MLFWVPPGGEMSITQYILKSDQIFCSNQQAVIDGYIFVQDNKIQSIEKGTIPSNLEEKFPVYDLTGKTVLPGFFDAHTFFTGWSLRHIGVDLSEAESEDDVIKLLKSHFPQQDHLFGHGISDSFTTPNPDTLEKIFPNCRLVIFSNSGDHFWLNRTAINYYGFDLSADCNEAFWKLLDEILSDKKFIKPLFKQYMSLLNSRGITSVKEIGFDEFSGFQKILSELEEENELHLRVHFMSQPVGYNANFEYAQKMMNEYNSSFIRFSGFNRMTDGSISQGNGLLKKPYENQSYNCKLNIDWDLIKDEVLNADQLGTRFSLNAQGDGAVAKAVDIFELCKKDNDGKLVNRHAITEAEFSDPEDLKRMAKLGIICEYYPQIQSITSYRDKVGMIQTQIGLERGKNYWNRRKMKDYGVPLCCGTDLPLVIDHIPESIYYSVTGLFPEGGQPFNKENCLTTSEVLESWTSGGAFDFYREDDLGSLDVGKLADIAVIDGDILHTDPKDCRKFNVCMTIINGKIVYQNLDK